MTPLRRLRPSLPILLTALVLLPACSAPDEPDAQSAVAGGTAPAYDPERVITFEDPGRVWVTYQPSEYYDELAASIAGSGYIEGLAEAVTSRIALPVDLMVEFRECGQANAFYYEQSIVMCYEFYELFIDIFLELSDDPAEIQRQVFGTGAFFFLHEMGHALVDLLGIPITGREEDSVDALATVILLLGGSEEALLATITNFSAWSAAIESQQELIFWGEHSLDAQRLFDIACMVYGSDPERWDFWVTGGYLPEARAARCPREYWQKSLAWDELLAPYYRE